MGKDGDAAYRIEHREALAEVHHRRALRQPPFDTEKLCSTRDKGGTVRQRVVQVVGESSSHVVYFLAAASRLTCPIGHGASVQAAHVSTSLQLRSHDHPAVDIHDRRAQNVRGLYRYGKDRPKSRLLSINGSPTTRLTGLVLGRVPRATLADIQRRRSSGLRRLLAVWYVVGDCLCIGSVSTDLHRSYQ